MLTVDAHVAVEGEGIRMACRALWWCSAGIAPAESHLAVYSD